MNDVPGHYTFPLRVENFRNGGGIRERREGRSRTVRDRAQQVSHLPVVSGQVLQRYGCGFSIPTEQQLRIARQIKVGSITRSERLAKYNRLLWLERQGEIAYPKERVL